MPIEIEPQLAVFIRSLPKTETHLHIEGALPWQLLQSIDPEKFREPPVSWNDDFKFQSFEQFEEQLLGHAFAWYTSPERYHEAAKIIFSEQQKRNVRYVETSFASGVVEFLGLDPQDIVAAINEAAPPGMEIRVFMGIHHNGFGEKMLPIIEDAKNWKGLAGIDLHGVESVPLEDCVKRVWAEARDAGLYTKAHAGEFCGADFVECVVDELGAQRVQHGVRSIESEAVLTKLVEKEIALDVCPISNIKLDVFDTYEDHSLPELLKAGVTCTVSTDDPVTFGNTIDEEYAIMHQRMGIEKSQLIEIAKNGFRIALMDDVTKAKVMSEFEGLLTPVV